MLQGVLSAACVSAEQLKFRLASGRELAGPGPTWCPM